MGDSTAAQQAASAIVRHTEKQNSTPRGSGSKGGLTQEAKEKLQADLRLRSQQTKQG